MPIQGGNIVAWTGWGGFAIVGEVPAALAVDEKEVYNKFAEGFVAWLRDNASLVTLVGANVYNIIISNREQEGTPPIVLVTARTTPLALELDHRYESYCRCLCKHTTRAQAEQLASVIYQYAAYKSSGLDASFTTAYVATTAIRPYSMQEIELEGVSSDTYVFEVALMVSWRTRAA